MAGNYWTSSQYKRWLLTKEELSRRRDEAAPREAAAVRAVVVQVLQQLGARMRYHPAVVATATTYFQRFYATPHASVLTHDPLQLAPTCLYLAAKVEEMGQPQPDAIFEKLHAMLADTQDALLRSMTTPRLATAEMFACEIELLEHLAVDLVVFHPQSDLRSFAEQNRAVAPEIEDTALAVLSDVQASDAGLVYPPFIVALAALYCASVAHGAGAELEAWLDELNLHHRVTRQCIDDILLFYEQANDAALSKAAVQWYLAGRRPRDLAVVTSSSSLTPPPPIAAVGFPAAAPG